MHRQNLFLVVFGALIFFSFTTGIHQLFNTTLQITVRNELGNTVEGAEVRLFKTEEDYENDTNQILDAQFTNAKGMVTIKNLEPIEYYVNVTKGDASNFGAGVQTGKLDAKKMNKVTIIIE